MIALIAAAIVMLITLIVLVNTDPRETFDSLQARISVAGLAFTGVLVLVTTIYVAATLRLADG